MGDLKFLFFRMQMPKAVSAIWVIGGEVAIGVRDYKFNTIVDRWLHFREVATLWPLLQTQRKVSKQAYT